MKVRHTETTPVILLGHGRSGTSIVAQLMREHLEVAFGTESQFIVRYYRRQYQYGDLNDDCNLRRLLTHLLEERWFIRSRKFNDFQTDLDRVFHDVQQRTFRGVLDAIFGQLAKHLGMVRYGDKTPEYNWHLDIIGAIYPDARYVHVVRDGRDVALSMKDMYVMPKHPYLAAKDWRDQINRIDELSRSLPGEQFFEIRYEDLLNDPVDTFTTLSAFLGIDDPNGDVRAAIEKDLPQKLVRSNAGKWKKRMVPEQVRAFEMAACRELVRYGYETTVTEPGEEPSWGHRAILRARSKLDLWRRPKYWEEHFHRVRNRARDAWRSLESP